MVKEVGITLIKYQRTDIPDGPVYVIPRSEVYVISYRNQVKDIINLIGNTWVPQLPKDTVQAAPPILYLDSTEEKKETVSFKNGKVLAGFGIIRGFTDVDNPEQYASSTSFPVLTLAYEVFKKNNMRIGIQGAAGSYKFSKQEFSNYDSAQNEINLKENIFTLHLYGKFYMTKAIGDFRPYVLGGIGTRYSYVQSEYKLQFLNNSNQTVLVKSDGRSVGIGALIRIGTEYYLTDQLSLMADAGIGPSVIQIGLAINTAKFK